MFSFLLVIAVALFWSVYIIDNKTTKKIRKHIFGFIAYYLLFTFILFIIFDTQTGISSVNDYFTSLLFIVAMVISFIIFLTNREIISSNKIITSINKIPEHIPFSHFFKNNLLALIKVNHKVKVLLRTPDEKNYIWILNQISAYNEIFEKEELDKKFKDSIEFIFLDNEENEIEKLFSKFKLDRYNYIVITSLSAIFKDAIKARQKLQENKSRIKIIGALSSVSSEDINKIINSDDNIIRVFPPDYDEANTLINFIFYRIISTVCISKICDFHNIKSNIFILHSGTYGSALSKQCKKLYNSEIKGLKYFTNSKLDNNRLIDNINYYSYNLIDKSELLNDANQEADFEKNIKATKGEHNYFYFAGYEPNISTMLNLVNNALLKSRNYNCYFIFCGTSSMYSWRKSILDTIERLECIKNKEKYYLKLKFYDINEQTQDLNNSCNILFNYKNNEVTIDTIVNKIAKLNINLNKYCKMDRNYITLLSQQALNIAQEVINNPQKSLLNAKYSIIKDKVQKDEDIKILVNGDSINQYEITPMQ